MIENKVQPVNRDKEDQEFDRIKKHGRKASKTDFFNNVVKNIPRDQRIPSPGAMPEIPSDAVFKNILIAQLNGRLIKVVFVIDKYNPSRIIIHKEIFKGVD